MSKHHHGSRNQNNRGAPIDIIVRDMTLNRHYIGDAKPEYLNSPEIAGFMNTPFSRIYVQPPHEVISAGQARLIVSKFGPEKTQPLAKRILRQELFLGEVDYFYIPGAAKVERPRVRSLVQPLYTVSLTPNQETANRLAEEADVLKGITGLKDYPVQTNIPVADFKFEKDANAFADVLMHVVTSDGVFHHSLPISVTNERRIATQTELAKRINP